MASTQRPVTPILAVLAALASAACGSSGGGTTNPTGHVAVYSFEATAQVIVDSLKYANAAGTLVAATGVTNGWTQTVGVPSGSAIEARVWGHSTSTSQTAKLKVEWVPQGGGAILQDSSSSTLTSPQTFTLTITRRTI